jgi:hypothetical protein
VVGEKGVRGNTPYTRLEQYVQIILAVTIVGCAISLIALLVSSIALWKVNGSVLVISRASAGLDTSAAVAASLTSLRASTCTLVCPSSTDPCVRAECVRVDDADESCVTRPVLSHVPIACVTTHQHLPGQCHRGICIAVV